MCFFIIDILPLFKGVVEVKYIFLISNLNHINYLWALVGYNLAGLLMSFRGHERPILSS